MVSYANKVSTKSIVLRRTEYGDADRVVVLLTSDLGKITVMAKGVRRLTSKLAAGVELLTINESSVIKGRSMHTLVSSRPLFQAELVPKSLESLNAVYDILKKVNNLTEDGEGSELFNLVQEVLYSFEEGVKQEVIVAWFYILLLTHFGQQPNLEHDQNGVELGADLAYLLVPSAGGFIPSESEEALFTANTIKALRLMTKLTPRQLVQVGGAEKAIVPVANKLVDFANYQLT